MATHRAVRYRRASKTLGSYADLDLQSLVSSAPTSSVGMGGDCRVLDIDGAPVFVKRIPLTDRELTHPRSTRNLFNLPMICQYGIGSPGLNNWREFDGHRHGSFRRG